MNILLITHRYPFHSVTEGSFLDPEIATIDSMGLLSNGAINLYIAPEFSPDPKTGNIPSKVKVVDWFSKRGHKAIGVPNVFTKLEFYKRLIELQQVRDCYRLSIIRDFRSLVGHTITYLRVLSGLNKNLPKIGGEWGLYTYWFNGATSACLDYLNLSSSRQGKDSIKWVVTRDHSASLYMDQKYWQPRRAKDIEGLSRVFTASAACGDYLVARHGNADKIECRHLGVPSGPLNGTKPRLSGRKHNLKVVSCSIVRSLKRVPLLCQSLIFLASHNPERKVLWVHFGSGPLEIALREILSHRKPPNLTVELRGNVSNAEVRRSLRHKKFDCFVTLSASEGGVPVSLQEAAEAGIPMIGTNVGGIPEIINERTGVLVSGDPTIQEVVDAIELVTGPRNSEYRKAAREMWGSNFDAARNHEAFYKRLLDL